jgi:hypothetical protein
MFGQRHPLLNIMHNDYALSRSIELQDAFSSAFEARSYLELLASGVFRLLGELLEIAGELVEYDLDAPSEPEQRQCYIKALSRSADLGPNGNDILLRKQALEHGLLAFGNAMEAFARQIEQCNDRASMAVHIEYVQVLFLITNCRETCEMACDVFNELFDMATNLAAQYIYSAPTFSDIQPKRAFALEPGVLPTVFLVATKCRDRSIRQRAIKLMRDGCMQEAMWDGKPYATFMERLVELEEAAPKEYSEYDGLPSTQLLSLKTDSAQITEQARFVDVVLVGEACNLQDARLVCARYCHETNGRIEVTEHVVDLSKDPDYLHSLCYGWR